MFRLSRILDDLGNRIPRRFTGRALWQCLIGKPHRTIRNIGREVEELERRDVPSLLGQQLFPSNYPMNQNIANAPVASNSAAVISHIGTSIKVHPDLGYDSPSNGNDPLYGIPFNVVHGNSVTKVNVVIDGYPSESDILPVPIPANAVIEGDYQDGPNLNGPGYNSGQRGDSHLIIWDEDNNIAYELFGTSRPNDVTNTTGQWEALQETVWNMNTDQFRTLGETSADAAGLSILAGLLRPDEALPVSQGGQGAIDHAIRFTLPSADINPQYIYPASHEIDVSSQSSTSLPLGARLRLENNATVDALIAKMGPEAQIVATAMQQYGLILADDGSAMYVTGTSASVNASNDIDLTWDMSDILGLESLTAGDFQVVNLTPIVTSLSESSGAAGNTVTITGQNFSGAAGNLSVFFGTTAATDVTYVSDTEITAVVPSGSGTVNVTVQSGIDETDNISDNPNANVTAPVFGYGVSATSSADDFTYSSQTISGTKSTVSLASSSVASGSTDLATIVVEDTNGNPVAGLASSAFTFALSGGKSSGTFGAVTQTSTPGTYTTTFTGGTAGTTSTLTTTINGVQLTTQPTIQVTPGPVSASNTTVSFASSTDASGTTDTITIAVEDADGNAISGLASSAFSMSLSGGTSTGTLSSVAATSTPGTYTATLTGVIAGTADTLALKVNTVAITEEPKVTVTPGTVGGGNSSVSFASSSVASGTTDTVTIVVEDAAGNAITGLASSAFVFSLGSGTSTGTFGTVSAASTPGTYTTTFTGATAGTASTLTLKINGVQLTSQPQVTVTTGSVSGTKSTVSFASSTNTSGTTDAVTIVVEDAGGNAITGLANSAFAFSLGSGTSTGTFGTVSATSTPGTYTTTFTGVTAGTASTLTLKVNSVQLSSQPQVTVTAGSVSGTKSTVNFAYSSDQSGIADLVTIVAEDAAGNPISGLASSAFAFSLSAGTSTGTFSAVSATSTPGTYTATFTGSTVGTASTLTLDVNSIQLASQPQVTVTPASISGTNSKVSFASATDVSSTYDLVTIVVENAAGSAVSGLSSSAFNFSLVNGTSTGQFGAVTPTSTAGTYTAEFMGLTAGTATALSLTIEGVQLTSEPTVLVAPGAVSGSMSSVSFASGSVQSGSTDKVTITVRDAAGNPISGLASSAFAFSLAGGASTGTFSSVTATSTLGVYTATFTGVAAGSASTLTLEVNGVTVTTTPTIQVTPGAVSAATSVVSVAASSVASGTTDLVTIVVKDANKNAISGLPSSDFTLAFKGGTSTGTFGTVTATSTPGTYTVNLTGVTAGTSSSVVVKINGVVLTSQPKATVKAGALSATKSTAYFVNSTVAAAQYDRLNFVLEDAAGNAITGLTGNMFVLTFISGTSRGLFGGVQATSTPGIYTVYFEAETVGTVSAVSIAVNGVTLAVEPTVQVT